MIKLRLASMSDTAGDLELPIIDGENVHDLISRIFAKANITENPMEIFNVAVNGELIEPGFWRIKNLQESDSVIIAPKIKSMKNAGQILVIVAIAVAAAYTGGAVAAGNMTWWQAGLINAGVATVASMAASNLIPPPVMDSQSNQRIEESQVYSISGQSNTVRKFGTVPKVYGRHRTFPVVAATPYTELEADPNTGVFSQYFYAIYDFGFGPLNIGQIKIGNTLISQYDQVSYRLVDPNRPEVSEGVWDDVLNKTFTIYKGDVSSEQVGSTINGNLQDNAPIDDYQIVRNAAVNSDQLKQEITVNLVCPRGLYAFDSAGNIGYRNIEVQVDYSKANENNWKPFNDPATVKVWSMVGGGGGQAYTDVKMLFVPMGTFDPYNQSRYTILSETAYQQTYYNSRTTFGFFGATTTTTYQYKKWIQCGVPKGALSVIMTSEANVGDSIKVGEQILGKVVLKTLYGQVGNKVYYTYTFQNATTVAVQVQSSQETKTVIEVRDWTGTNTSTGYVYDFDSFTPDGGKQVIIPGKFQIRANTQQPHFATLKFTPDVAGEYKVRITRSATSLPKLSANTNVMDELTWINIVTRTNSKAIRTDKRHAFMEIRVKATGQLNGAIQNLSAICTSVLPVWNGAAWVKQPTRNPAWIYADILTGEVTKKPISKNRLHLPSLVEWANHSDAIPTSAVYLYTEKRYNLDFILDFEPTVQNMLQQIASACQATPNMVDGKYGVLLDIDRTVPTQIFTPRNSWGFASTRDYKLKPHALKVKFIDPARDWQMNEITAYDSSYNETNSTEIQDLNTFGVTVPEQALRYGRYFAAQHRLRQETYQLKVDFENLVCSRGDFVKISQDVMKVGGVPARVKTVVGNQITIDDKITIVVANYGYTFRKSDGQVFTNTMTLVSSDTFLLNGDTLPAPGDLIVVGEVGNITFDCIVKSIIPEQDFSATLFLVEKAAAVYDFEDVSILSTYDPRINPISGYEEVAPPKVTNLAVTNNYYTITSSDINYFIDLDWDMPPGSSYEAFEVYVDFGRGYELQTVVKNSLYSYPVNETYLNVLHSFKVLAVSANGKKLLLGEATAVTATPVKYTLPPPDVTGFVVEISGETVQFFWNKISGRAISNYMIRYSPITNGSWEQSTVVNEVSADTNLYSTQARLGSYYIKAIDRNGKESVNAAKVITTVPALPNMNFIDLIDDFPALAGTTDKVIKSTNLILDQSVFGAIGTQQFYAEGFYYLADLLDVGDVFTVRLTSKIIAQGVSFSNVMANWLTLDSVASLSSVKSSDWDVELQYRTVNNFTPMSAWTTLGSIASIGAGSGTFTNWRKFLVGDATGKQFQFRLKLISYSPDVTPRVDFAQILAEMAGRSEEFGGLSAPDTGLQVNYENGFYGPGTTPNVQITLLNGASGDYWNFVSKTLTGFNIVFFDNLGNPVARQFNARATGYGSKSTGVI